MFQPLKKCFKKIFSLIKSNSNDQKNCSKDQNQKNKEKLNFLTKGMKIKKRRLRAFARTRAKNLGQNHYFW